MREKQAVVCVREGMEYYFMLKKINELFTIAVLKLQSLIIGQKL